MHNVIHALNLEKKGLTITFTMTYTNGPQVRALRETFSVY